tara:strand:- start:529 stop:1143 length:615 start_codon:yes stop_codon:yes gene_type:complete
MKSIGYFGDSFCASNQPESWCVLLAEKLGHEITHFGKGGASVWHTFMAYEKMIKHDRLPDTLVFCWTEPYRLYHPEVPLAKGAVPYPGPDQNLWKAADMYYVYLQNYRKDELAYQYALQWFDRKELPKSGKKIIQMWSMKPFELTNRGCDIELQTGEFIDESMLEFAWGGKTPEAGFKFDINLANHMTVEQNKEWANKVYDRIS